MSRIAGTVPSSLLIQDGESVRLSPVDGFTWQSHKYATTKSDVGLSNADNTSDLNKPVSTATQTEINSQSSATRLDANDYTDTKVSGLATVAHTGSYDDLGDKPTIIPQVNADWNATSGKEQILNKPTLGTASSQNSTAFATSLQGSKADTAVQPSSLATVATSGDYADLSNKPTIPTPPVTSVNTKTGDIVLDYSDVGADAVGSANWAVTVSGEFTQDEINALTSSMSTVAFSGSYNDLSNKPTIPTVHEQSVYVNGAKHINPIEVIATATVSSGNAVFDISSGGNAVLSEVFTDSISLQFVDSTGVFGRGNPTVSGDKKSITVPITKQSFSGVSVVGINVLGSVTMNAAPNGTVVKLRVLGR